MSLKKKGNTWYARYQTGGRETWISTHQRSKREAERVEARISACFRRERETKNITRQLLELVKDLATKEISASCKLGAIAEIEAMARREALLLIDDMLPAPPLVANDIWDKYIQSAPDIKQSTLKTKQQRFGKFSAWAGDMDMRDIKDRDCRKFLEGLGTERSQTINNYVSDLSSVWKASPDLNNPWGEHLRQRSNVIHKGAFTRDQVRRILAYCKEHDLQFWHTAVTIAYYTGLRLKDVVYFNRQQITDDGYIDLIPAKTARTGKGVRIPISPGLAEELKPWLNRTDSLYLFSDAVKKYEAHRAYVQREFKLILDATGIYATGLGFHSLRHTFVTEAINAGIDTKQVQSVVGHEAVEITEGTYYHGEKHADLSAFPAL